MVGIVERAQNPIECNFEYVQGRPEYQENPYRMAFSEPKTT